MTDDAMFTRIHAELTQLAQEVLGRDLPPLDADLTEQFDSAELLGLVVAIEDHFEIAFDEQDEQSKTLEAVIGVIVRRRGTP
ncbi:MAG: phosphopantetheine-binding protein [Myxococcota bacterium]